MSQQLAEEKAPKRAASPGRRKRIGRLLLILGPTAVAAVAAFLYWTGGRYVSTDNAYIQSDKTTINSEVSGNIVKVFVAENDSVRQDDPLFQIDNRDYVIAVEQAKSQLQSVLVDIRTMKARYRQKQLELELAQTDIDFADTEFRRQTLLARNQVIPKADLDESQHTLEANIKHREMINSQKEQILAALEGDPEIAADQLSGYRLAEAKLKEAELYLAKTTIQAPFSGRVSKIPSVGKQVAPGRAVMSLIADNNFWVEANIKETDLTHIHQGQRVEIEVDTYPGSTWQGTVQSISPAAGSEYSIIPAQNATGNWVKVVQRIPVRISVENSTGKEPLRTGMSSSVRIDTGYHRRLPPLVRLGLAALGIAGDVDARQNDRS